MKDDQAREFYSLQRERDALIHQWERLEYASNFEKDDLTDSALHHRRKELHEQSDAITQQMIATIKGSK